MSYICNNAEQKKFEYDSIKKGFVYPIFPNEMWRENTMRKDEDKHSARN